MKYNLFKKELVIVIIFLLVGTSITPSISVHNLCNEKTDSNKYEDQILKLSRDEYNNIIIQLKENVVIKNSNWLEEDKLLPSDGAEDNNFGQSVSIDDNYVIIGAYKDDENGNISGSAYIFERVGSNWSQEAKLLASDGAAGDRFGWSVSINGDYAIIGAYGDGDIGLYSGSAYIFKRDGSNWSQEAKLLASDGKTGDFFGWSVSIDSNFALIGAYGNDDNGSSSGSAYIFERVGSNWSQEAKLLASDGAAGDRFGWSVSIDENYAIVGAHNNDGYQGSTYIFKRSNSTWAEEQKMTTGGIEGFGYSVSISGDYVNIGAPVDGDNGHYSGSAFIFKRVGLNWSQEAKLLASDGVAGDNFGASVSIDGIYTIIGAVGDDDSGDKSGSAYIFKRVGSNWYQQTKLLASDGTEGDIFGNSVSIVGTYCVIGAYYDDDNGENSGSAYIFNRSGTNQLPIVEITYPEEGQKLSGKITINGTANDSDGNISFVQIKIDNYSWENAIGTTIWTYEWDTKVVPDGQHIIYARSYDGEDYSNITTVNVTVENDINEKPTVKITYPFEGDKISGIITINGTANDSDGNISFVQIKIDNYSWENAAGTTNWTYEWNTTTVINGTYKISARSFDGTNYSRVDMVNVTVDNEVNQPPSAPIINGPNSGKTGKEYEYTFNTTEPNGDDIYYYIDWGDGNVEEWIGIYNSSNDLKINHTWDIKGTYNVKAKAKDIYDAESDWGTLEVIIPKYKFYNIWWLTRLLEKFPLLNQLLQILGRY